MSHRIPRRRFLQGAAAAGIAPLVLTRSGHAWSPLEKLRHASIGVGGMGAGDLNQIASHPGVEIAAICDVDLGRTKQAAAKFPDAHVYQDWRELFEKEGDRIDSVNVTTPDHMHAAITMTALRLGKHVYCQKPLTHDVREARLVAEAAAKAKVATQMGTQLVATHGDRLTVHWIRRGAIGRVEKVYLWSNKDPWKYRPTGPRPEGEHPVPEGLDWDKWLGTAPVRPYVSEVYHPTWWRGWQDFGVGWLGDMGCHIMDGPFRALRLTEPICVSAEVEPEWRDTPGRFAETWPTWQVVRYIFGPTELTAREGIEIVWSDGFKYPPDEVRARIDGQEYPTQGALFLGEAGTLLHPHGGEPTLHPSKDFEGYPVPDLEPRNHYHQWVDACFGKGETVSSFDVAGPLTQMILHGTIALRLPGKKWFLSARKDEFIGAPEANRLLSRTYREGWEVEGL